MTRSDVTVAMSTALNQALVQPLLLVDIETASGTLYLNTGATTVSYNAHSYLGDGQLKSVPQFTDSNELRASSCTIQLNSALQSIMSVALTMRQSYGLTVFFAVLDTAISTVTLISDPVKIWAGKFDHAEINTDPQSPVINLVFESELLRLTRPGTYRYSPATQQKLFPGDRGFEYLPKLEDWSGYWGRAIRIRTLKRKRDA